MGKIEVDFFGIPEPQSRPRTVHKNGRVWSYSPKSDWRNKLIVSMRKYKPSSPLSGNLNVTLVFRMPRRKYDKSGSWWMNKRPDWDNLAKAVTDAMQDAKWIEDDGQIVRAQITKRYQMPAEEPGCLVQLERIDG